MNYQHVRNYFLAGSYTVSNGALYLNTALLTPTLLNISDSRIGSKREPQDIFLVTLFLIASISLGIASIYSFSKKINRLFDSDNKNRHSDSSNSHRFFQANGWIGTSFKTVISGISFYSLLHSASRSVTGAENPASIIIPILVSGIASIGNFFAQASILCNNDDTLQTSEQYALLPSP